MSAYFEYTRPLKSLTTQIQDNIIMTYCEENGITQLSHFKESDFNSRTELARLFKHITPVSNTIIVTDIKVLWNDIESQMLIINILKHLNANIIVINSPNYSIYDESVPSESVLELINTFYQQVLATRLSEGRKEKVKRGRKSSGIAPIGYKWDSNGQIIIDLELCQTVDIIFKKYFELKSLSKLVNFLEAAGLTSRNGTPFTKGSLHTILKNDFYIGFVHYGDITKRGHHPLFIDKDLFDNVQALMFNNQRNRHY